MECAGHHFVDPGSPRGRAGPLPRRSGHPPLDAEWHRRRCMHRRCFYRGPPHRGDDTASRYRSRMSVQDPARVGVAVGWPDLREVSAVDCTPVTLGGHVPRFGS